MAAIRQTNFGGGELSPLLWGRTDLGKFAVGLRRCRNFFISRHGAAVSRPGTKYIGEAASTTAIRLVPFVYSDSVSYVLEFGHHYVRPISDGAFVASGGSIYQLATTYAAEDLAELQWVQSGDVLVLTHRNYPPRALTRLAHNSWAIADIDFSRPEVDVEASNVGLAEPLPAEDVSNGIVAREWAWAVTSLTRDDRGVITESKPVQLIYSVVPYGSAWSAAITYQLGAKATSGGTQYRSLLAGNLNHAPPDGTWWVVDGLSTSPTPWNHADLPARIVVAPGAPVTVQFRTIYGSISTDPNWIAYRIYRGRGGLFGWVGDVEADTFTDVGNEPDYAMSPPQGLNPFEVYDSAGALVRTEHPSAVAYFEERRVYGGTVERPGGLFLSATGDYDNFDSRQVQVASEALTYELAARKLEDVRTMVGLDQLLVGTGSSIWAFGGSGGEPLSPDVVPRAKVSVEIGTLRLPFLVIGQHVLFARAKGAGVRSLVPGQGGWESADVSSVSNHLFTGTDCDIVDWTYAEDPWGLVWAVRADGALLSFTYSAADNLWAWARHDTDGLVRNVCAVPEGPEDAVYLVVERDNGTFIERMNSRVRYGTTHDDGAVDCAWRAEVPGASTMTDAPALADLEHLEGQEVYVVGKGNPVQGPYTVQAGTVQLDVVPTANSGTSAFLWVGLPFTPELETLDVASGEARLKQKRVVSVGFEVDESRGLQVGQDFDNLEEWQQRKVADSYGSISAATELVQVFVAGTYDTGSRAALRQTWPLPVTVVGVTRGLDVGG